jgi:hypothetical protein
MKPVVTFLLLAVITASVSASPVIRDYYTVVMDENGHGFITQSVGHQIISLQLLSTATNVADPFATAHPDNPPNANPLTLSYGLPAGLQDYLSRTTPGDIVVGNSGGKPGYSDLIRIGSGGRIYTYSDLDDATSSLADVGIPLHFQPVSSLLPESYLSGLATLGIDIPQGAYGCYYLPGRGQAGSVTNGIFSYYFLSEGVTPSVSVVPEPGTVAAGLLLLIPLGIGLLRSFRKTSLINARS